MWTEREKKEKLNQLLSRFEEANQFNQLISVLTLRLHNNPVLPILTQLISNLRDNALDLGIDEAKRYKNGLL